MTIDAEPRTHQQGTLEYLDPKTLILGPNVRQAKADKDLVDSVRELGVLQPITVYSQEGQFVVHCGGHRTLAAIEAGLDAIPALVVPQPADADRIFEQLGENKHRKGNTAGEELAAFQQLAALGVPAAQIVKRGAYKRPYVDTALKVVASELASKATQRYDFLTLDQAAVLTEFEGDREAITELVRAARDDGFAHAAQKLRDKRARAAARQAVVDEVAATGVVLVEAPEWGDKTVVRLGRLTHDGEALTTDSHAGCPGHAAFVTEDWEWRVVDASDEEAADPDCEDPDDEWDEEWDEDGAGDADQGDEGDAEPEQPAPAVRRQQVYVWVARYVCTDAPKYGHTLPSSSFDSGTSRKLAADMTDSEREAATAQRRDVIQSNKDWDSAEKVRRNWLREFMSRPAAPKTAGTFIAGSLARADHPITQALTYGNKLAAEMFGLGEKGVSVYGRRSTALTDTIDKAKEPRALMISLGLILAAYEDSLTRQSWRSVNEATARYLHFLEEQGYKLSHVEKRATGDATGPEEATTPIDLPTSADDTEPPTAED
ncbi:ParB N-terminal domain-containing protein [Micromonospora arborensis]|uniref:ParB/RepB/Spo0J family partition protein n=1 Tax=Micromonospora arborensis TaxID=2116518 RepID=UPI0033CF1866